MNSSYSYFVIDIHLVDAHVCPDEDTTARVAIAAINLPFLITMVTNIIASIESNHAVQHYY